MPIGNSDKLMEQGTASWDAGLRAQPAAGKVSKQGLCTDKTMSASEFIGTCTHRHAAERQADVEALKDKIDGQYQLDVLGDSLFDPAQECTRRDFDAKAMTGGLQALKSTAETLDQEHAVREAIDCMMSPAFEKAVLGPLSHAGTQKHPYAANPQAWDLHVDFIRREIQKMRTEGLENCTGAFKDLVAAVALGKDRTP